jgi:predicted SAM-dependent methyltransferase
MSPRASSLAYRLLRRVVPGWFTRARVRELYPAKLLATVYLAGDGIEIGALNNPLPVPPGARVRYVDCASFEHLQKTYPSLKIVPPDVIDDGETLATFGDSSVDFVIANHFLEHTQDPIGTFKSFFRVVRPDGILFITLPDKRFTFDVHRPVTTWEHLLKDHAEGPEWSRRAHFEEAIRLIVGITDPEEVEFHVERDMREVGHTHYHVWTQTEMLEMLARLKGLLDFEVEAYVANAGEGIMVLRKGERGKDGETARASLALARRSYAERYHA